ncbi:MAG: hypothetical protein GVY24_04460 [Planctomycetes bacterium]|nr:hypothetical protein [Planctomycetota bacterium]
MALTIAALLAGAAGVLRADPVGQADPATPPDAPLSDSQARLLALAMNAASKLPHHPYIKDRSRLQMHVVDACLQLDQPSLATRYMKRIDNWRRGQAAAEYAIYLAERGYRDEIERYVRIAVAYAQAADADWRKAHIRLRVAQARMLTGDPNAATRFNDQLEDQTYRGRTAVTRARIGDPQSHEQLVQRLDELIGSRTFDAIVNASAGYVELYRRYYQDPSRREEFEKKIRQAYRNMAVADTLDMLMELGQVALEQDDPKAALRLVSEAEDLADRAKWPAHREYEAQYRARLARLRYEAGDQEQARSDLDEALAAQIERFDELQTFRRADALTPVAEAYQLMGAKEKSLAVYEQAVKEFSKNRNFRVRVEDLTAICVSLALHEVQPTDNLWSLLEARYEDLGPP